MVKIKKLAAVLLSVVMLVCCFTVQASAASIFSKAKKISAADAYSHTFNHDYEVIYKIVLPDSGYIRFYCSESQNRTYYMRIILLDTECNTVVSGSFFSNEVFNKDFYIEKKGTYYIRIVAPENAWSSSSDGFFYKDFYYSFQPDNTPVISLLIKAKVGDKFDFSAITSDYSGKITWKSTDTSIAVVNKGKAVTKKRGKARIRAYLNNGDYAEIVLSIRDTED